MTRDDFEAAWKRFRNGKDHKESVVYVESFVEGAEQRAFNAGFRAAIEAMNKDSDRQDRRKDDPK